MAQSAAAAGQQPPQRDWAQRPFVAVLLILLVGRLLLVETYRAAVNSGGLSGADFHQFYDAARHARDGQPLYATTTDGYPYSPFMALLLRPLATLSPDRARAAWIAVSIGALSFAVACFACAVRINPLRHTGLFLLWVVTAFRFWPTVIELGIGNVDMLLLALLAFAYLSESRDRPLLTAAAFATGALIKTWFIGLVIYLILRRANRAALAAVGFFALGLIITFGAVGWRQFPQFVTVTRAYSWQPNLVTLSAPGITRLYFTPGPNVTPIHDAPALAIALTAALLACLAISLYYGYRTSGAAGGSADRLSLLSLSTLVLLMALPVCHLYYFVLVLPSLWLLLTAGRCLPALAAAGAYLMLTIAVPALTPVPEPYRHAPRSLLLALPTAAALILWITTASRLRPLRRPAAA